MHKVNTCEQYSTGQFYTNLNQVIAQRLCGSSLPQEQSAQIFVLKKSWPHLARLLPDLLEAKWKIEVINDEAELLQVNRSDLPGALVLRAESLYIENDSFLSNIKNKLNCISQSVVILEDDLSLSRSSDFVVDGMEIRISKKLNNQEIINRLKLHFQYKEAQMLLHQRESELAMIYSEYQRLRVALFEKEELSQVTLNSIGDGVIATDVEGRIRFMNPVAEKLTEWRNEEAVGASIQDIFRIYNELTGEAVKNPVLEALNCNRTIFLEEYSVLISRHGIEYPVSDSAAPIRDRYGKMIGAVLVFRDVSESRQLARRLSWQATHDALTQLLNRGAFERQVSQQLQEVRQHHMTAVLCYFDLDQFKIVNDTCGHAAGDELLRQITLILKQKVRARDFLGRLGGDEFGLLFANCSLAQSQPLIDDLLQAIRQFRFSWQGRSFKIGASVGVVVIDSHSTNFSDLLAAADAACYAAKQRGRDCISIYRNDDQELARQRNERQWISRITQALDEARFCLYIQKIHPLKHHRPSPESHHYEVLLRLVDEQGHLVPPMAFIPAAERYNLMPTLDRWVIQAFLSHYRQHLANGNPSRYSVNLSGASINDPNFIDFLENQIAQHHIPVGSLCFEITETAAIANLTDAARSIRRLKAMGCYFSLDDFGSGMSSLSYLKNLPVDYLKIDGSFVKNINQDPVDRAMVEGFNRIAQVMGIQTIAEFVETPEILETLQFLGIDYAQGHAIDHPHLLCRGGVIDIECIAP